MISAGDGLVGGVLALTDEMCQQGAAPCWLKYLGVDDVDACVASVTTAGGGVLMPAVDIPQVGRMAMLSDPQGAPFYIMCGASDEQSTACAPERADTVHGTNCTRLMVSRPSISTRSNSAGQSQLPWIWQRWVSISYLRSAASIWAAS
jgi:hypothetical protein